MPGSWKGAPNCGTLACSNQSALKERIAKTGLLQNLLKLPVRRDFRRTFIEEKLDVE